MAGPRTTFAALAGAALLAAGCGDDDAISTEVPGFVATPIAEVADIPPGEEVALEGRAYPYADLGYVLAGPEGAVFVTTLPTEVAKVQPAEVLRVQGTVEEIGPGLAESIATVRDQAGFAGAPPEVVEALSLEEGAPLITSPSTTGEGDDASPAEDQPASPN